MAKQNTIRKTIHRNVERQLVKEYLLRETERAGYGGLRFNRTPEGTEVTIQAEMVGRVYGRRGKTIRELNDRLRNDFDLFQPQLQVEEIEDGWRDIDEAGQCANMFSRFDFGPLMINGTCVTSSHRPSR